MNRLPSNAGIAIGPILFVLAMIGILASVFAAGSGTGSLGTAAITDRVTADVVGQANLIRTKIMECQMQNLINGTNFATSGDCVGDAYPCSDQTNGTAASALTCPNDPLDGTDQRSLWTGLRPAAYPQPTAGFNGWMYMNAGNSGGRCFWTSPTNGNTSLAIVEGLKRAASKFTTQELSYSDVSNTQKFVIFITRPTGVVDSHCAVP